MDPSSVLTDQVASLEPNGIEGDNELVAVQKQLEALQDQKQAFLHDLAPLPPQGSLPLSMASFASARAPDAVDIIQYLKDASKLDRELHYDYCSLSAQATSERSAGLQQFSTWQSEDAKRLAEIAAKRRIVQAAYIAEREAILMRDYEERLSHVQAENTRLRVALLAAQSGRVPDLGIEVTGTHQRGQRGVEVTGVTGVALESGAEAGDVVVGVGWHARVDTAAGYGDAAARVRPGDLVTVDAYRNGRPITFHIVAKAPGELPHPQQNTGVRSGERRLFCYPVTEQRSALDVLTAPRPGVDGLPNDTPNGVSESAGFSQTWLPIAGLQPQRSPSPAVHSRAPSFSHARPSLTPARGPADPLSLPPTSATVPYPAIPYSVLPAASTPSPMRIRAPSPRRIPSSTPPSKAWK